MYFPRLYPDELLYSGIARCRVHLGIISHKTLLHMLFGDTKVAAITDLPTHLAALANNTGLDTMNVIMHHTMFPLYAHFIPQERRNELFQAMLAADRSTIGLAGASTALIKWPKWLRYCPVCVENMAADFGEPYWRRSWQIQGIDVCSEHGCQLLNSPIPFRRAQRHEFHSASPLLLSRDLCMNPASAESLRLAKAATQLLTLDAGQSPGYVRWTNLYRYLASECGARRGRQVKAEVIWEKVVVTHRREWLAANGLLASDEPPRWLLALFRKHRKAFSAVQHLIVWSSLRPGQHVSELIEEANSHQTEASIMPSKQLFLEPVIGQKSRYRGLWQQALDKYGAAKAARISGGNAYYAWLYRHDRAWLVAVNQLRHCSLGNNRNVDWQDRDRTLVRLLVRIGNATEENLCSPRKSRSWFLRHLPHRASVERHIKQLPLCGAFLDRYAESVSEYQIRRLTKVLIDDAKTGLLSRRWELERRCGLDNRKMAPMTIAFIRLIGVCIE